MPLLYLKGTLLPKVESDLEESVERFVSEEDWLFMREKNQIGYWDSTMNIQRSFEERMYESDDPDVASVSENLTDIYNTLKDFLINYRNGVV